LQKDFPVVIVTSSGRHQYKLICDPFFVQRPSPTTKEVHANRSYDIASLGKREKGNWVFLATLTGSGDAVELLLHQWRTPYSGKPWTRQNTIKMPLYSDGNSNCINVGTRNSDINELISQQNLGLPVQPKVNPKDDPKLETADSIQVTGQNDGTPERAEAKGAKTPNKAKDLIMPGPIRWRDERRSVRRTPYQLPTSSRARRPSTRLAESLT